jgi:glycosyltransferase involved in cell wall biosynthesis
LVIDLFSGSSLVSVSGGTNDNRTTQGNKLKFLNFACNLSFEENRMSNGVAVSVSHVHDWASPEVRSERSLPFVSIIMPCRNEERHIANCLDSILATDYPRHLMEILVLDAMSEDRTREIVSGYTERFASIRLLDNPERHIPVAMNIGIRAARGERILKMDAHSTYPPEYVSRCVLYQDAYDAENAGGVWKMVPGADTLMARAIVAGLGHRFGSGNANVKIGVSKPTWSDTAAFGCFKKDLFERIGMYDEKLLSSSDLDLNQRIQAAGGGILIVPDVVIKYAADATLGALRKHVFADGVWVSYVLKFKKKVWSRRHWVPAAFLLSLVASLVLAAVRPVFLWSFLAVAGIYAAASLTVSLQLAIRERDYGLAFLLPAVFAVRHFVHGAGTLYGLMLVAIPGEHWKGRRSARG